MEIGQVEVGWQPCNAQGVEGIFSRNDQDGKKDESNREEVDGSLAGIEEGLGAWVDEVGWRE